MQSQTTQSWINYINSLYSLSISYSLYFIVYV